MISDLSLACVVRAYTTHGQTASDYFGAGRINGVQVSSSSQAQNTNHHSTINGAGMDAHLKDASPFLGHATMGFDCDDIQTASESGFDSWIGNQVELTLMSFRDTSEKL